MHVSITSSVSPQDSSSPAPSRAVHREEINAAVALEVVTDVHKEDPEEKPHANIIGVTKWGSSLSLSLLFSFALSLYLSVIELFAGATQPSDPPSLSHSLSSFPLFAPGRRHRALRRRRPTVGPSLSLVLSFLFPSLCAWTPPSSSSPAPPNRPALHLSRTLLLLSLSLHLDATIELFAGAAQPFSPPPLSRSLSSFPLSAPGRHHRALPRRRPTVWPSLSLMLSFFFPSLCVPGCCHRTLRRRRPTVGPFLSLRLSFFFPSLCARMPPSSPSPVPPNRPALPLSRTLFLRSLPLLCAWSPGPFVLTISL